MMIVDVRERCQHVVMALYDEVASAFLESRQLLGCHSHQNADVACVRNFNMRSEFLPSTLFAKCNDRSPQRAVARLEAEHC